MDESTLSGGVGATVSALVSEALFDELDAPVRRYAAHTINMQLAILPAERAADILSTASSHMDSSRSP